MSKLSNSFSTHWRRWVEVLRGIGFVILQTIFNEEKLKGMDSYHHVKTKHIHNSHNQRQCAIMLDWNISPAAPYPWTWPPARPYPPSVCEFVSCLTPTFDANQRLLSSNAPLDFVSANGKRSVQWWDNNEVVIMVAIIITRALRLCQWCIVPFAGNL